MYEYSIRVRACCMQRQRTAWLVSLCVMCENETKWKTPWRRLQAPTPENHTNTTTLQRTAILWLVTFVVCDGGVAALWWCCCRCCCCHAEDSRCGAGVSWAVLLHPVRGTGAGVVYTYPVCRAGAAACALCLVVHACFALTCLFARVCMFSILIASILSNLSKLFEHKV